MYVVKFNIRKIRLAKRMSQKQLARKCNLAQSYISDLENDFKSPTLRTVISISNALNVHPLELLEIYLV